ncbi:histidinol-phosphate transaminase, partial [Klebsiella pneumoniae]|nr:histidinol-phosphate transaminase [Klebsiella pneumoniae]
AAALRALPAVRRVYPSQANFLLVRLRDAQAALDALQGAGVVVRDMRHLPGLHDALRITVGTHDQNRRLLDALAPLAEARPA